MGIDRFGGHTRIQHTVTSDPGVGSFPGEEGFFIEDDGSGIPPAARREVFDWQHSTKDGGTGIGLRSVKQITEAEGWSVRIADGSLGGARFEFRTTTPAS